MADAQTPSPAVLAQRMRNACASVRAKSYPLADLIPLMQQAADALAAQAPAQQAEPPRAYAGRERGAWEHGHAAGVASQPDRAVMQRVRDAITAYHLALDRREHGGVAAGCALDAIQDVLGMPWVQGAALSKTTEKPHGN